MRWRTWISIAVIIVLFLLIASQPSDASSSTDPNGWHSTYMTWYGPGFYRNRTACGQTMTRKLIGVAAHSNVPCGTTVELRYRDPESGKHHRFVKVVDHCGCAAGSKFDATARLAIHLTGHPPHSMKHVHYLIYWEVR